MKISQRRPITVTAAEAVSYIESNSRVFIHGAMMTPGILVEALSKRESELHDIELVCIHTDGPAPYLSQSASPFFHRALFCGKNVRNHVASGNADYVPIFLSDVPRLFRSPDFKIDVALLTVSLPDAHGYCSLSCSVDVSVAALEQARMVVAVVNPNAPRTLGDGLVHVSQIDISLKTAHLFGFMM